MARIPGIPTAEINVIEAAQLGRRVKVAVSAARFGVDPIASCVGAAGSLSLELNARLGVFVEFVEFDPDLERYVANALRIPVLAVRIDAEAGAPKAVVVVEPAIYPIALGKQGFNARLASSLTGYFVTICTPACSSTTHHHPVGLRVSGPRPTVVNSAKPVQPRGAQSAAAPAPLAPSAPQRSLVLPPLPAHVRRERAGRRRRVRGI